MFAAVRWARVVINNGLEAGNSLENHDENSANNVFLLNLVTSHVDFVFVLSSATKCLREFRAVSSINGQN